MPVGQRYARDDEGHETKKLRDYIPQPLLCLDDVAQVEGTRLGHYAHQRQTDEHLIAQGLGRGPQAARSAAHEALPATATQLGPEERCRAAGGAGLLQSYNFV